uniref:Family with sequence similarity 65, member C n=1 Tax=Nothobranchius furzeri TaxID=105023 RepID=A0A1A7ZNT3_NOTFU
MSVKLRFDAPADGGLVQRSRSFAGFGALSGRQRSSSVRGSFRSKAVTGGKSPRTHLSSRRGSAASWSEPEQVDQIFQALRKGLKDYLAIHQAEMDFLSSQQRETKRNSRLGFLYDLEKEIRAVERYIRRLEFQISQVEELYETYCIQWRLCRGVVNMKRAFSLSPSSRASRESLVELSRNHRHSLQDMSAMEGELEILLGELHIKMKGLIGFARLCPGDQYEVVVRLGRQRWRIRGRIESDDSQSWEEEEMVFLPHIQHNFDIKVMEAKGLGWLLVGMVTCASVDFFVAKPQLMLVDITELGTIKLQLEVTWNPFDSSEKMKMKLQSVSKQSVSSRKSSVYSWTAPNTPSFSEKYFLSMVRELQDQEGSLPSLVSKSRRSRGGVSLLSYLSDPSHTSVLPGPFNPSYPTNPGTSLGGSQTQLSFGEDEEVMKRRMDEENDLSLLKTTSSEETLAVEEVLGSFDFLSHDLTADDDASCLGSLRLKDSGISSFQQSTLRSLGLLSKDSQSASEEELVIAPLTSGNWGLDQALETHLDICCILLQAIPTTDFSPSRRELLEEISIQTQVLNRISCLLLEKNDNISARDLLPKAQRSRDTLLFWQECGDSSSSPFFCHVDDFSRILKRRYTHKVKAKQPGQSDKVFSRLLLQLQAPCRLVPCSRSICSPERVSVFQLSAYLKRWNFQDLGEHISCLSREEYILSALNSPKRRRALNKLRGRAISELLPLGFTLQTLGALLIDSNHRVCKAASSCVCRAAGCKSFRNKAVVFYTESLRSPDVLTQLGSCLALKCLRATESVDHISDLWRSEDEDLRSAARETVLSFGKKGHEAFQRMDQLFTEMQEEAYKNQETEITIL